MAKTMHFTLGPERLHPAFANLNWQLHREGKALPFRLNVANALWIQAGYPTHAAFRQIAQDHYASDLKEADFAADIEGARRLINGWVEKQTQGMVRELLRPENLEPGLTRLVTTNAVYFRADWRRHSPRAPCASSRFRRSLARSTCR